MWVKVPKVSQRGLSRVEPAHSVDAGTRRSRRGAQKHAPYPGPVGVQRYPGSEHELARAVGAGDDVAADVVGVVGREALGRPVCGRHDLLPEARSEPLDLPHDGLGRVPWIAVRYM